MVGTIYIFNGPNLNLLGEREPEIYGHTTLDEIEQDCESLAVEHGYALIFQQSNHEGELVDWLQQARKDAAGVIINAGALTHTSVAVRDALSALNCPSIELHISNIYQREAFRHHSYLSAVATAVICGFGASGYRLAMQGMITSLLPQQGDTS